MILDSSHALYVVVTSRPSKHKGAVSNWTKCWTLGLVDWIC